MLVPEVGDVIQTKDGAVWLVKRVGSAPHDPYVVVCAQTPDGGFSRYGCVKDASEVVSVIRKRAIEAPNAEDMRAWHSAMDAVRRYAATTGLGEAEAKHMFEEYA